MRPHSPTTQHNTHPNTTFPFGDTSFFLGLTASHRFPVWMSCCYCAPLILFPMSSPCTYCHIWTTKICVQWPWWIDSGPSLPWIQVSGVRCISKQRCTEGLYEMLPEKRVNKICSEASVPSQMSMEVAPPPTTTNQQHKPELNSLKSHRWL